MSAQEGSEIVFKGTGKGEATRMWLEYASVTTTENFILSALTVKGTSQIVNAACEPHVQEMCDFLEAVRGDDHRQGDLDGLGRRRRQLGGADYTFNDDFHEIATFLALSAVTGGDISVRNGCPENFDLIDRTFGKFGAEVTHKDGWSRHGRTRQAGRAAKTSPPT